jgi:hypothetical protein
VWQKCRRAALGGGDVLIHKGVHRCGSGGYVDLVVTPLPAAEPMQAESVPLLGLEAGQLENAARRAGATAVERFGSYRDQPYDRRQSTDLVIVAAK